MANSADSGVMLEPSQVGIFTAKTMTAVDVAMAYAVVQSVRSDISLEEWRTHIEPPVEVEDRNQGALVATDPNGYIVGVCSYVCRHTLGVGLTLEAHDFCVVSLARREDACGCLLQALEKTARSCGCDAVRINFLTNETWPNNALPGYEPIPGQGYIPSPPAMLKRMDG